MEEGREMSCNLFLKDSIKVNLSVHYIAFNKEYANFMKKYIDTFCSWRLCFE